MPIKAAYILPHPPIILPEIGAGEELKIKDTTLSFQKIASEIAAIQPDTIVLTTPHSIMYTDYFHISPGKSAKGNMKQFGAKQIAMQTYYDTDFIHLLDSLCNDSNFPGGILGEENPALDHGTMVPLYFINQKYKEYKLVRIGLSGLTLPEHYHLGQLIQQAAEQTNKKVVVIASGDLSHKVSLDGPYGYSEDGVKFDQMVTESMRDGDFLQFLKFDPNFTEKAAECGLRSFVIMSGALDGIEVKSELLSYQSTFGVGYGAASYYPNGNSEHRKLLDIYIAEIKRSNQSEKENEDAYVKLARLALETFITKGVLPDLPSALPIEMLSERAGVFVSLKKYGQLRGCIGTIEPVRVSIAEEILENAISAGTNDPRFDPVTASELPLLSYSVDILSKPEPIDSKDMLHVKKYGIIVTSGTKRGLLLPNLEGVDTVDQQIQIALQKAGIGRNQKYQIERFKVVRHK